MDDVRVRQSNCSLERATAQRPAVAMRLVEELRQALRRGELEVCYQPIVDCASLRIAGFEALLRWNHPQRGRIPPDDFIPLAEATGLIHAIGKWTLLQACAECAAWPSHIKVAVNVSAVQLRDRQLPAIVAGALMATGLAPERLELEVTESAPLASDDGTLGMLHRLRAFGVSIALDDLGKGCATLTSLANFHFDRVKIDRDFLKGSGSTYGCSRMVAALAAMARTLQIATTVEGVETGPQVAKVRVLGCTQMQGFVFGGPMPAQEARGLVAGATVEHHAPRLGVSLMNDDRIASNVVVPLRPASISPEHSRCDRSIA